MDEATPPSVGDEAEIVVVGAGPAGSACAAVLAEAGHDVLLIDQSSFPRPKACGDGLSSSALAVLKRLDVGPVVDDAPEVTGLRLIRRDARPLTKRYEPTWKCVARDLLDEAVFDAATARGSRFMKGRVDRPLSVAGRVEGVVVRAAGTETAVRARCIIAADGATSRLGRTTGLARSATEPRARAIRQYFRTERALEPTFDVFASEPLERAGIVGYGWVFPLGDHLANVGIGYYDDDRAPSLRAALDVFARELATMHSGLYGALAPTGRPMGAYAGVSHPATRHQFQRILFIGDAGGMTDPITGEGISHALRAGALAAEVVHDALSSGRGAEWHADPDIARRLRNEFPRLGRDTGLVRRYAGRQMRAGGGERDMGTRPAAPFVESAARMVAEPDTSPTLTDTTVAELLERHDRAAALALEAVNDQALDALQTETPFVTERLHRDLRAGDGPLAAATLLLSARVGGSAPSSAVVSAAVGVQLLSLFSVLTAQIAEAPSESRTGRWVAINNALALLVADFAVSRGFQRGVAARTTVGEHYGAAGCRMFEGELLARGGAGLSGPLDAYLAAAELARGSLYELAAATGAELAGCDDATVASLGAYGLALGTATRIADDARELADGSPTARRRRRVERDIERALTLCEAQADAANGALRPLGGRTEPLRALTELPGRGVRRAASDQRPSRWPRQRARARSAPLEPAGRST